jgi:PBP1b-binding outer membrane lipoprotein LpoB
MKILLALSTSALVLAGCATEPETQLAQADCKVAPIVTADSSLRHEERVTDLDRRYAEMQLGTSDYRFRNLQRNPTNNNIEDSLRDCARK